MTKEDLNETLTELMHKLLKQDKTYSADGTPTLTVKMPDGTFRKKPAAPTEYFPSSAYQGARDTIFCFSPEDPQEWAQVEVGSKDLDNVFPLFLDDMKHWASVKFMPGGASRGNAIDATGSVSQLVDLISIYGEEDRKRAEEADATDLTALPNFGIF